MQTLPSLPIPVTTAFGLGVEALKLTLDATGRGVPHGQTVTYPTPVASVAVRFSTTPVASAGTPPRPATSSSSVEPAVRMPIPANLLSTVGAPARVSRMRTGDNGVIAAGTWTGTDTSVLLGSASTVSIWLPLGTVVGTTMSMFAV